METFHIAVLPIPDMVVHPNTVVPIYIFEPSYVDMIDDCIKKGTALGVCIANPRTSIPICTLVAPTILERRGKEEISVLLQGFGRAKLEKITVQNPWPVFEAVMYEDRQEMPIFNTKHMERLSSILNNWLIKNIDNNKERTHFLSMIQNVNQIVDFICMLIIKDLEIKEIILASESLNDRIRMVNLLLKDENPFQEDPRALEQIKSFEKMEESAKIVN